VLQREKEEKETNEKGREKVRGERKKEEGDRLPSPEGGKRKKKRKDFQGV